MKFEISVNNTKHADFQQVSGIPRNSGIKFDNFSGEKSASRIRLQANLKKSGNLLKSYAKYCKNLIALHPVRWKNWNPIRKRILDVGKIASKKSWNQIFFIL